MLAAWVVVGAHVPSAEAQAQADGGRLEATRSSVRPSTAPARTQPVRPPRPAGSTRAVVTPSGTRIYTRPVPTRSRTTTTTTTRVHVYHVTRRQPAPAVPAPEALRPPAPPLNLEEAPPPRPPFQRFVSRWPYEARRSGWVVDPWKANPKEHRRIAGRVQAEGSYQYRGLWRTGFAARVGSPRVDVDSQLSYYIEPAKSDALYLGDTTLNFAPVALPGIVWRVGLGARYMADANLTGPREFAAGWNLSTSIDAFPGNPFVISARLDRGMLYQTPVWRARATVGIVYRRFELYGGYDHTQVAGTGLGGPLLGLRAWL